MIHVIQAGDESFRYSPEGGYCFGKEKPTLFLAVRDLTVPQRLVIRGRNGEEHWSGNSREEAERNLRQRRGRLSLLGPKIIELPPVLPTGKFDVIPAPSPDGDGSLPGWAIVDGNDRSDRCLLFAEVAGEVQGSNRATLMGQVSYVRLVGDRTAKGPVILLAVVMSAGSSFAIVRQTGPRQPALVRHWRWDGSKVSFEEHNHFDWPKLLLKSDEAPVKV